MLHESATPHPMVLVPCAMQEARFEHAVRQNVYEERQNQLRWQVKVGDEQISNKQRGLILDARAQAYSYYKVLWGYFFGGGGVGWGGAVMLL